MSNTDTGTQFLSEEWAAAATERLNEDDDVSALAAWADLTLQYVVTDVPGRGEVTYFRRLSDGEALVALGAADGASLTLTMAYDVAVEINKGALDVPSAFSQERLTIEGELGPMMTLRDELTSVTRIIAELPTAY